MMCFVQHRAVLGWVASVLVVGLASCDRGPTDDDTSSPGPSCGEGYVHDPDLPGAFDDTYADGCVPAACGVGSLGGLAVDGTTVYVDGSAPSGGDGSQAAPFDRIQEGLDAAGAAGGLQVAVAAGIYVENLALDEDHDGVSLEGRCQELVVLDGSDGEGEAGIRARGFSGDEQFAVSGMTVERAPMAGIDVSAGHLVARRVLLQGNGAIGAWARRSHGELTLEHATIVDSVPIEDGSFGRGITAESGATLTATSTLVQGNREVGIVAMGQGTEVFLRDVEVRDTLSDGRGELGQGIHVEAGGWLSAESCTVAGNREVGVLVRHEASQMVLVDVDVRDTAPSESGAFGYGVQVSEGAGLQARSCRIESNTEVGLIATDHGTQVELADVEVRDTRSAESGVFGRGLHVAVGARLTASDCNVEGNREVGINVADPGTEVVLTHVQVSDTLPTDLPAGGYGMQVAEGATVLVDGGTLTGNTGAGINAYGAGTTVSLDDVLIADTAMEADGLNGRGIDVHDGAWLTATDSALEGNHQIGIAVNDSGTVVWLTAVEVVDTEPDANGEGGFGLRISGGATLSMSGGSIERNHQVGVIAVDAGTSVALDAVAVRSTRTGVGDEIGVGIIADEGASLAATSCTVEDNRAAGVIARNPYTVVRLEDVEVTDTRPDANPYTGLGILVFGGATLQADSCRLQGNGLVGIEIADPGTFADLVDVEVRDTLPAPTGEYGRGIEITDGAAAVASGCTLDNNRDVSVHVDAGAFLDLSRTVVTRTRRPEGDETAARGITCQTGALLLASDITVELTEGPGLFLADGGEIECVDCVLRDNTFAGAVTWWGSRLTLDGAEIADNGPDAQLGGGLGLYLSNRFEESHLLLRDSVIEEHAFAGIWLESGWYPEGSSCQLVGNELSGGVGHELAPGVHAHGDAVFATGGMPAWDGTSGLLLENNTLRDSAGAGVFLHGSSALLSSNTYLDNAVDVWQQACEETPSPVGVEEAPVTELCPLHDRITAPIEFHLILEEDP